MKDSACRLNELLMLIRPAWYKTRKRFIKLEYYDFNGNPIFIIEADISKRQDLFIVGVDENLLTLENLNECIELTDLRIKNWIIVIPQIDLLGINKFLYNEITLLIYDFQG